MFECSKCYNQTDIKPRTCNYCSCHYQDELQDRKWRDLDGIFRKVTCPKRCKNRLFRVTLKTRVLPRQSKAITITSRYGNNQELPQMTNVYLEGTMTILFGRDKTGTPYFNRVKVRVNEETKKVLRYDSENNAWYPYPCRIDKVNKFIESRDYIKIGGIQS